MARTDMKEQYSLAVKNGQGVVCEVVYKTTEVIQHKWIQPELERRVNYLSSWFVNNMEGIAIEDAMLLLLNDQEVQFFNNLQHIKDVLNELEIDYTINRYQVPVDSPEIDAVEETDEPVEVE